MKENIEEDIEIFKNYILELNNDIQETKEVGIDTDELEKSYFALKNVLDKLAELQKENAKLKEKLLDTLQGQKVIKGETPEYIKENYIPKQAIKDKLEQAEEHLIETDKRIEQPTTSEEEEIVLWVIGIRLTERIKVFKELLGKAADNLSTKFVSKIKIKEKIGKLEKELDFYAGRDYPECQDGKICDDLDSQIKALKELLEEQNNEN